MPVQLNDLLKIKEILIEELTNEIQRIYSSDAILDEFKIWKKEDKSFVTALDIFISQHIQQLIKKYPSLENIHFISEEAPFDGLSYPCIVIDPIDGTRELIRQKFECALSFAYMSKPSLENDGALNWGWVFNPFSGFSISSDQIRFNQIKFKNNIDIIKSEYERRSGNKTNEEDLLILVSKSEFEKGLYSQNIDDVKIKIAARGSIAFKLGLLSAYACNAVVSKRKKNIWDIAAGTLLAKQHGFSFYSKGEKVNELSEVLYNPPLIWCKEADFLNISHWINN